jgi:hypothetical protein
MDIGLIVLAVVALVIIILPAYFLRKIFNPILVSVIVGLILVVINSLFYGLVGGLFTFPALFIFNKLSICSGEGCWIWIIVTGNIELFVLSLLVGWFINKRLKSQKTV